MDYFFKFLRPDFFNVSEVFWALLIFRSKEGGANEIGNIREDSLFMRWGATLLTNDLI